MNEWEKEAKQDELLAEMVEGIKFEDLEDSDLKSGLE